MSARARYCPWWTDGAPRVPSGVRHLDRLMAHSAITFTRAWSRDLIATQLGPIDTDILELIRTVHVLSRMGDA